MGFEQRHRTRKKAGRKAAWACMGLLATGYSAPGQSTLLVEDFEFCTSDQAAGEGVTDITDLSNQPALYIHGEDENASPQEGFFSIGTDAVFCINWQVPCTSETYIGFHRLVDPDRFPFTCSDGEHYAPLEYTYGDPANPGSSPPDFGLSDLTALWDAYGDGAFADGLTGTNLWLRFIDCEGEAYEFVNYSEPSLYSELWTLDVVMGRNFIRLSPQSLIDVPEGDRLLTEVAAIEVMIQDNDDPPTTVGKWYVDNLRLIEPASPSLAGDLDGDADVDLFDFSMLHSCLSGPGGGVAPGCENADLDREGDVDSIDFGMFQTLFAEGGQS